MAVKRYYPAANATFQTAFTWTCDVHRGQMCISGKKHGFLMTRTTDLVSYTNTLLEIDRFRDYCPNGLQVQGRPGIRKLVAGVTACRDLIEAAQAEKADAILVHHGYFWKGEDASITGMKYERVRRLLEYGISLLAYHLPLDAHAEYGNNVQLAQRLGLVSEGCFGDAGGVQIARYGHLSQPVSPGDFARRIDSVLGRAPLHIAAPDRPINTVGWCTGAAQGYLEEAARLGLDAYLTGEISEPTVHVAREYGIHFFACGHHATERYGADALGQHLSEQFDLDYVFIDIDNPV